MNNKKLILPIVIGVILVIFLIWYFTSREQVTPSSTGGAPGGTPAVNSQSLGGELYEKAQNPIGDKLPETDPIPNPIEGVYKNPFAQ